MRWSVSPVDITRSDGPHRELAAQGAGRAGCWPHGRWWLRRESLALRLLSLGYAQIRWGWAHFENPWMPPRVLVTLLILCALVPVMDVWTDASFAGKLLNLKGWPGFLGRFALEISWFGAKSGGAKRLGVQALFVGPNFQGSNFRGIPGRWAVDGAGVASGLIGWNVWGDNGGGKIRLPGEIRRC